MDKITEKYAELRQVELHYGELLETYRHHFELFVKGYALNLAGVATTAGYAFSEVASVEQQRWLLLFAGALSIIGVTGSLFGVLWARHLERQIHVCQTVLELQKLSLWGAKGVCSLGVLGFITILCGLLLFALHL